MKSKILVATLITVLLIAIVSTPMNVLATTKSGYDDPKKGNDDDKNKNVKHDDDDHKTHNSCINLPSETPFRDLWIFVCSFQTQIDQINVKLNALSTGGGGTGGSSTTWCPAAANIDLSQGDFRLRSFEGCNLSNAQLNDAQFQYTNLKGTDLTNANFGGTNLSYADLSNAKLQNTDFTGANLNGIITTGCHYGTTQPHGTPSVGTLPVCVP